MGENTACLRMGEGCSWLLAFHEHECFAWAILKTPKVFVLQEIIQLLGAGAECLWGRGQEGPRAWPGLMPAAQVRGWWPQLWLLGVAQACLGGWGGSGGWGSLDPPRGIGALGPASAGAQLRGRALGVEGPCAPVGPGLQPAEGSHPAR